MFGFQPTVINPKPSQEDLLLEAARTEVENLASLKLMMAQEEELKRRAAVVKKQYSGPSIKYRSSRVEDHEQVRNCNSFSPKN